MAPSPPTPSIPEAAGDAARQGLEVATRQLNRVMEMLQNMDRTMAGAVDGLAKALQNMGGDQAMLYVGDALQHLPEVMP